MWHDIVALFVLALPVACISWTLTHEEILREPREWCAARSRACQRIFTRKFFYVFTCEYCLSHYVTVVILVLTRFTLLYDGWLGSVVAGFSLVWIANVYMGLFGKLRQEVREERAEATVAESRARAVMPRLERSSTKSNVAVS